MVLHPKNDGLAQGRVRGHKLLREVIINSSSDGIFKERDLLDFQSLGGYDVNF